MVMKQVLKLELYTIWHNEIECMNWSTLYVYVSKGYLGEVCYVYYTYCTYEIKRDYCIVCTCPGMEILTD